MNIRIQQNPAMTDGWPFLGIMSFSDQKSKRMVWMEYKFTKTQLYDIETIPIITASESCYSLHFSPGRSMDGPEIETINT